MLNSESVLPIENDAIVIGNGNRERAEKKNKRHVSKVYMRI